MERFWSKVNKESSNGCWEWTAAKASNGYGSFRYSGKTHNAHRLSWILHNGDIPSGMCVCHSCDNRACVNPSHMFLGTQSDNMQDKIHKGRQQRGEDTPSSKLNQWQIRVIKRLLEMGQFYQREIGEIFGVHQMTISDVKQGRTWCEVTGNGHRNRRTSSGRIANPLPRLPRPKHW